MQRPAPAGADQDAVHAAATLPAPAWALGSAAALANWLFDVVCLLAVARACDAEVGTLSLVGAYLAIQFVRQVPLTPGGVGLVEAALLAALVAGGATGAAGAAVVLTYRLLSCWLIVLLGLPACLGLRGTGTEVQATRTARTASWKPGG